MLERPSSPAPRSPASRPLRGSLTAFASLAALLVTTAVTPARAQDAQQQAMGRTLFNEGMALFDDGKFEAACPKFEASLKHYPGLGTRGKLAECYESLGRFVTAWQQYRELVQLAMRSGDPLRERVANERAKALEPKLSYVKVTVAPGNDVTGLTIKRDGNEVERSKIGAAEPVDAGIVAFEVSAPGRKTFKAQITVVVGQTAKFDVPALESAAAVPPPAVAPPPSSAPVLDQPVPVFHDPPSWQKPTGVVLMGIGAVGIGIGAGFGLSARSTYDGAFAGGGCDSATKTCDAAGQSAVDDARTGATVSTILFAAGGALAVGGLVLFLTAPSSRPLGAVRVLPTGYAGGGGLTITGAL